MRGRGAAPALAAALCLLAGCRGTPEAPAGAAPPPLPPGAAVIDLSTQPRNHLYPGNRPPLAAAAFERLPLGSIRPRGWLLLQLRLLADGLTRRLPEFDPDFGSGSAWLGGGGESWERGPYYFRGLTALAYVLQDPELIAMARRWLDWTLEHQDADGWLGPAARKADLDWWPNMIVLDALRDYHSATGDPRVVEAMRRYHAFLGARIHERPLASWARARGGDALESIYWLFDRTGDRGLLGLGDVVASQTHDYTADYLSARIPDAKDHVVNHAMGFKQPAIRWQGTGDPAHLEAIEMGWEKTRRHHGRIDGMFSGDEPLHGLGSTAGTEMCAIVEMMQSAATILRLIGDPRWGDRLEKVAFNALPGGFTADLRGFQYYSQQNQAQCTLGNHGFHTNHENDLTYGPQTGFNCCRSNLHMGWPRFAAALWLAAPGDGLAAVSYAPCEVGAMVGEDEGTAVKLDVSGDYPFAEAVEIRVEPERPVRFPLALRIPAWCEGAEARVNGGAPIPGKAGTFLALEREWRAGDRITLNLPMRLRVSTWIHDSAGIELGPLALALEIDAEWKRFGGPEGFPAFEVLPKSPWNYALVLDRERPDRSLALERRPLSGQPFDPERAPVLLRARGRRIPDWRIESNSAAEVPPSPVPENRLAPTTDDITLIPYGAAKLRIALLPWTPPER